MLDSYNYAQKTMIFKKFVLCALKHYICMLTFFPFLLSKVVMIFNDNQVLEHLKIIASIEIFIYINHNNNNSKMFQYFRVKIPRWYNLRE